MVKGPARTRKLDWVARSQNRGGSRSRYRGDACQSPRWYLSPRRQQTSARDLVWRLGVGRPTRPSPRRCSRHDELPRPESAEGFLGELKGDRHRNHMEEVQREAAFHRGAAITGRSRRVRGSRRESSIAPRTGLVEQYVARALKISSRSYLLSGGHIVMEGDATEMAASREIRWAGPGFEGGRPSERA